MPFVIHISSPLRHSSLLLLSPRPHLWLVQPSLTVPSASPLEPYSIETAPRSTALPLPLLHPAFPHHQTRPVLSHRVPESEVAFHEQPRAAAAMLNLSFLESASLTGVRALPVGLHFALLSCQLTLDLARVRLLPV